MAVPQNRGLQNNIVPFHLGQMRLKESISFVIKNIHKILASNTSENLELSLYFQRRVAFLRSR
jgi:hypothetical protein